MLRCQWILYSREYEFLLEIDNNKKPLSQWILYSQGYEFLLEIGNEQRLYH